MWRDVQPDVQAAPLAVFIRGKSFVFAARALHLLSEANLVFITKDCRKRMTDHLRSGSTELGGLLLGTAYVPQELGAVVKGCIVVIQRVVESEQCRTSSVSLAMDTEVWDRARGLLGPGTQVVGWYHSHPNLGAFFSGTDRRTQRAFFNYGYSVGVVIDPIRDEQAWFSGPEAVRLPPENIEDTA